MLWTVITALFLTIFIFTPIGHGLLKALAGLFTGALALSAIFVIMFLTIKVMAG